MSDAGQGCIYTVVIGLVLLVLLAVGVGYVLEQWEGVQRAEAAVQEQQTIQQRDYYAFLATMAAMGRSVGSPPAWVWLLIVADVGLLGYAFVTRRRG